MSRVLAVFALVSVVLLPGISPAVAGGNSVLSKLTIEYPSVSEPGSHFNVTITLVSGYYAVYSANISLRSRAFESRVDGRIGFVRSGGQRRSITLSTRLRDRLDPGSYSFSLILEYGRWSDTNHRVERVGVISRNYRFSVGAFPSKLNVYVYANDVDWALNSEYLRSLFPGREVIRADPSDWFSVRPWGYVVILGGPDAPEVGSIVRAVLGVAEENSLRKPGTYRVFYKTVRGIPLPVAVLAGYDRTLTKMAVREYGIDVASRLLSLPDPREGTVIMSYTPKEGGSRKVESSGKVRISYVLYDPKGPEPDNEVIGLKNVGGKPVDIGGWVLSDGEGRYVIPHGTVLEPGERWRVKGSTYNPTRNTRGLWLNNKHDCVYLYDSSGKLIDSRCW